MVSTSDNQAGLAAKRERDHDSLTHPAGELVGIMVDALVRIGDPDFAEQLDRPVARRPFV